MSIAAMTVAGTSGRDRRVTVEGNARLIVPYDEAMCMLGDIGKTTFFGLIDTGEIERVKIGRRGFITAKSIVGYVDRLREATTA